MNANEKSHGKLALIIFLLFVGVYPAYSYLKYNHNFLPWFPFISIPFIFSIFYFITFFNTIKKQERGLFFWLSLLLFFYGSCIAFFSLFAVYDFSPVLALKLLAATVIQISCLLPICLSFDCIHQRLSEDRRGLVFLSLVPLIIVVIDGVLRGREFYGTWELYQQEGAPLVYLAMSDAFAVIGLLVYVYSAGFYKSLYFVISLLGIYFTYSRSSLYFFIISIFIFEIFLKRNIYFLFISALGAVTLFVVALLNGAADSRFLVLLTDPWSDPSFVGRLEFFKEGIEDISNHFLFGNYGYEVLRDGDTGGYIHNFLSYWAAYGVLYFLVLSAILFFVCLYIIRNLSFFRFNSFYHFPVLIFIYSFVSGMVSKAYVWPFLWFAVIFICSLKIQRR